jgi:hypothetical protein
VALISGAVVALGPEGALTRAQARAEEDRILTDVAQWMAEEGAALGAHPPVSEAAEDDPGPYPSPAGAGRPGPP